MKKQYDFQCRTVPYGIAPRNYIPDVVHTHLGMIGRSLSTGESHSPFMMSLVV